MTRFGRFVRVPRSVRNARMKKEHPYVNAGSISGNDVIIAPGGMVNRGFSIAPGGKVNKGFAEAFGGWFKFPDINLSEIANSDMLGVLVSALGVGYVCGVEAERQRAERRGRESLHAWRRF